MNCIKLRKKLMIQNQVKTNDNLEERYNEALLKKSELSMKENDSVIKKLNLN